MTARSQRDDCRRTSERCDRSISMEEGRHDARISIDDGYDGEARGSRHYWITTSSEVEMSTLTATTAVETHEAARTDGEVLSNADLIRGTMIAVMMATAFTVLSSGLSLMVSFVPGIAVTWMTYVWLYFDKRHLPTASTVL